MTKEELLALNDEDFDISDIPELDEEFFKNALLVYPDGTTPVTLRVKRSVLEAFKAGGKGYQTRMNAVLEAYVRAMKKAG